FHRLRSPDAPKAEDRGGSLQEILWAAGVSGDLPVVLLELRAESDPLLEELIRAYAYWDRHGVAFDLVVVS
ncbi:MAG: hypothetical protein GWO00_21585, partial [Gemmatimonadetes bacterium]|nr:hypothetical protein [Gemmatimonadota bacterium]NIT89668.1 hypothetical protein [Gemmatimonadota bacterium]NIU33448.1 hypothetical protein [Gemmatimonadota bacterium]NIV63783.1 hypothetical protein [Gemmatimonadota bacterium]NIW66522.1 hypothetical protein [Gemmatimonadota bacterium]